MARKAFQVSKLLKGLKDQLTCPLCIKNFTNPKTLPCLHSFCQHCLQAVPLDLVQSDKYQLPCPTCRSSCELPETGVAGLPISFLINNLTEVYNLLKKVSGSGDVSCDNCEKKTSASGYCKKCGLFYCHECLDHHQRLKFTSDHKILSLDKVPTVAYQLTGIGSEATMQCFNHNKLLNVYCETCEEIICQRCTVHIHKHHNFVTLSEAYERHKQALETGTVQPLKEQVTRISEALAELMKRKRDVTQQGEGVKREIHTAIQNFVKQFYETERHLMKDIDMAVKVKVGVLDEQVKNAKLVLSRLTECLVCIEQCLKVGTPQSLLSSEVKMKERSKSIVSCVQQEQFEPVESADIRFKQQDKQVIDIPNTIGSVHYSLQFTSKVSISMEQLPLVGRKYTCTLSLSSSNGSPVLVPSSLINCSLSTPDRKLSMKCSVKESRQTGEYTVTFTPITRGLHQLHVRIGKSHVRGSPVSIPVSVPPEKRGVPVRIITGLQGPWGVAVTEDQVIVSEYDGHCITILNKEGEETRSFGSRGEGKGQFNCPIGVAVTNGRILVADRDNHRIQQFTMGGGHISCVGSKGTGPLQFSGPRGIAVNETTGQVFVADSDNDRIQVLNPDLSFSHMFGTSGSKEAQLSKPWDLTVDNKGTVLITDSDNHRIQQFTPQGKFLSMFNTHTEYPVGIVSQDNVLYVSHHGDHCLSMYTTSGEHVSSIGGKDDAGLKLNAPQHMSMDSNGYLYLCDCVNSNIFIL